MSWQIKHLKDEISMKAMGFLFVVIFSISIAAGVILTFNYFMGECIEKKHKYQDVKGDIALLKYHFEADYITLSDYQKQLPALQEEFKARKEIYYSSCSNQGKSLTQILKYRVGNKTN